MLPANITDLRFVTFTLLGIPGLQRLHSIISAPLFLMFFGSVTGNPLILFIILSDSSLHSPMYLFLSALAITDFMFSLSVVPQMLANFWFHYRVVSFGQCLIQMFFVHFLSYMESGVLVAMAFDRYIAICQPLRYSTILTVLMIKRIGLVLVLRGVFLVSPCFYLVARLPFCGHQVITNPYCDHMSIAKVSCGDITANNVYGMIQVILAAASDISCIALSYTFIIQAVLKLTSREARSRTFSTCSSHVCVISLFYIPCAFSLLAYRFAKHIPHSVHSILSLLYLQLPPIMNPVVYGMRTGQIRDRIWRLMQRNKNLEISANNCRTMLTRKDKHN